MKVGEKRWMDGRIDDDKQIRAAAGLHGPPPQQKHHKYMNITKEQTSLEREICILT